MSFEAWIGGNTAQGYYARRHDNGLQLTRQSTMLPAAMTLDSEERVHISEEDLQGVVANLH